MEVKDRKYRGGQTRKTAKMQVEIGGGTFTSQKIPRIGKSHQKPF